jgi:hypothetical protein
MVSEANQRASEDAGLSFILGMKVPDVPYQVGKWRKAHSGEEMPDELILPQPWPATGKEKAQGRRSEAGCGSSRAGRPHGRWARLRIRRTSLLAAVAGLTHRSRLSTGGPTSDISHQP